MTTNQSQYEEMCEVYERYNKGDLVLVVRCKDCVFFRRYGFKLEHTCARFDCHAPKDGYCCWAERREDERK